MKIHPTAVIHPEAILGEAVEIGPYVVIEGPARIGDRSVIQAHAIISGCVSMGRENLIGYAAVIGADPQDFSFKPEVRSEVLVGDRNRIREHCTVHRGTNEGSATIVGNDCFLMAGAHLGHNVRIGNSVVIANNALLGGHVQVGDQVFIGGGAVFHQHTHVGRLVIAQGMSGYSKDIPPFMIGAEVNMVAGLNVVGMRRAGLSGAQRREIKEAFSLVYRQGLNVNQALAVAREKEWGDEAREYFRFVEAAKKRGICALLGKTRGEAVAPDES